MKVITDSDMKIQFHLGNPQLIPAPTVSTCAFNERIQKIVVNAEDLMDEEEKESPEEKVTGVIDVELEEERERMRKEEEMHPDEVQNESCL